MGWTTNVNSLLTWAITPTINVKDIITEATILVIDVGSLMARDIILTTGDGCLAIEDTGPTMVIGATIPAIQSLTHWTFGTSVFGGWATNFGGLFEKFLLIIPNTWKYFTNGALKFNPRIMQYLFPSGVWATDQART